MNPITLPVAELKPALIGLSKIISKRTTLPVLSHVHIERTKTATIELAATDLDTAVIATLPTPTQGEPTSLLVPFEDLQNLAKGCGRQDTLIIALTEDQATIRFPVGGQMLEHRCASLPVTEFPPIADIHGEPVILDRSLRCSIHEALQCASTDETRPILNGACLDTSKPKAHYIVGTDGRHLFTSNSFVLPLEGSLVIPRHRFLEWKEFEGDGDWALRVAKPEKDLAPQFEIASTHWRFITRSIDGNYPNWRVVVPADGSAQMTVEFAPESVEIILQLIARIPDNDPLNHSLGLEIEHRSLHLVGKAPGDEAGHRIEVEGIRPTGRDVTVHLNRHLLIKALRFGLTKLEIIDSLSPVRFCTGGRQMIVMPVRPDAAPAKSTPPSAPPPAAGHQNPPNLNPPPSAEQPKETMPNTNGNPSGAPKRPATDAPETTEKPALEIALSQIEVVRGDFRNAIAGLNKLGDLLKQVQRENKASEKEIQSVRQTLRSLQTVRI